MPGLSESGADQPTYGMEKKPLILIISIDNLSGASWPFNDFTRGIYANEFCVNDGWYRKACVEMSKHRSDDVVEFFNVFTLHIFLPPGLIREVSLSRL